MDSFLSLARVRTPGLYSLLWHAYSCRTRLFFGEAGFASETGIQQRDPIEPALFVLLADEADRGVQFEFYVWYLDNATLGDCRGRVHGDLVVLLERLRAIGLEVNGSKCELTILNDSMQEETEALFRGLLMGLGWLKRVTFHCWELRKIYKGFQELFARIGKLIKE